MATHDYVISNASGAAVRADLNNALAAIVSNNSNATEPSTTYAYQWWADTGSSPAVMKLRNAANDAWIELFQLDGEWSTIALEDGTAAAPSLYFKDSGTDTGIFSPTTDEVAISTGGTEALRLDSSGRLLVGTSSSSTGALVEVNGRISGSSIAGHVESFDSSSTSPITLSYTLGATDGIVVYVFSASSPSVTQTPGQYLIWRETTGASVNTIAAHSSVSSFACNGSTGALTLTPNTSSFRSWRISITKVYG